MFTIKAYIDTNKVEVYNNDNVLVRSFNNAKLVKEDDLYKIFTSDRSVDRCIMKLPIDRCAILYGEVGDEYASDAYSERVITVESNNGHGGVEGSGRYTVGETVTIKAYTSESGWEFLQWNDGSTEAERQITVTEDATYTATFTNIQRFIITVEKIGSGEVSGGGRYAVGETVTITAMATSIRWNFSQWNDGSTEAERQITVTEDATYTATFVRSLNMN